MTNEKETDPQTVRKSALADETTGAVDSPPRDADPVQANHVVFIAQPRPHQLLDCETFDTSAAPHRQPPRQMHDATDFPERFTVPVTVVEILQNPIGPMPPQHQRLSNGSEAQDVPHAYVAFALGGGAFRAADHTIDPAVYDARYCERLNKLISAKFLVVHAYPVYVDRGNRVREPWEDLGTDAGKANARFDTLEEAQAHAAGIVPTPPPTP